MAQFNLNKVFDFLIDDPTEKWELVYAYLKNVAKNDIPSILSIIDRISEKRDKNLISQFLSLVILWLRDALNISVTNDEQALVNMDYGEAIANFSRFFEPSDFGSIIEKVEQARTDIERNAHPALTLTHLSLEMNAALKRKTTDQVREEAI